jgi:uncharacterized protein (DUF2249 family)
MSNVLDVTILDVRELEPKERHSTIFSTYTDLKPGEHFVLVNDHEPRPLLYQFQAEHDGEFDWWPLEQGPDAWRIRVEKREHREPKRTVTEFLQSDHSRLDRLYDSFTAAIKEGEWESAATGFAEFNHGLRRHIRGEEEILFPLFEEKTGMTEAGPTHVMKTEHIDIKETLEKIENAIARQEAEGALQDSNRLRLTLGDHNMKEENILYPESDSFISEAERAAVVKKIQAL